MSKILLVEDDKLLRLTLTEILEKNGFTVFQAALGRRLFEVIEEHQVDLILLDVILPDGNGIEFLQQIREMTDVPVIVISGNADRSQKLSGLESGADDYVDKPFDMDIFVARIKANIRRGGALVEDGLPVDEQKDQILRLGKWILDKGQNQLFDEKNESCGLTKKEFKLVDFMIKKSGTAVTRDMLADVLQEKTYRPSDRAIDVKISRIRKKIEKRGITKQVLRTIHGTGYVFDQQVFLT